MMKSPAICRRAWTWGCCASAGAMQSRGTSWRMRKFSNSTMEIAPVVSLDGAAVGTGEPGALWRRVDELLQGVKRSVAAP